jgi:hypothetical protein
MPLKISHLDKIYTGKVLSTNIVRKLVKISEIYQAFEGKKEIRYIRIYSLKHSVSKYVGFEK